MKRKQGYKVPVIVRITSLSEGVALLSGSIVDNANVTSVGQKIDTYDFSTDGFNHNWEDAE
mgnify:CR=1 FL=1